MYFANIVFVKMHIHSDATRIPATVNVVSYMY